MLRYFEQEGLLQPPRCASGYRNFSEAEERRVNRIVILQKAGLKLSAILQVLPCLREDDSGFHPCEHALAALRRELDKLDARISDLDASRRLLAEHLAQAERHA